MALSKAEYKIINEKLERVAEAYMSKYVLHRPEEKISFENVSIAFGYKNSEKLVKQSRRLTGLTIWLAITASAMTGLALVQWLEYLSR